MPSFSDLLEWVAQSKLALCGFSVIIIATAVLFAMEYRKRIRALCGQIQTLESVIRSASPTAKRDELRKILEDSAIARTYLALRYRAFIDTLIRTSSQTDQGRLISTIPAADAIDARDIGAHEINFRVFQGIPNVLIGLGLFFTFLGLTAALLAATQGATASDVTVAQKALNRLLGAATFKFITSLIGLVASILFGFEEKNQFNILMKAFNGLQRLLQDRFPYQSTQNLISLESTKSSIKRAARISTEESLLVINESLENPVGLAIFLQDIARSREEAEEQTKLLKTFSTDIAASIAKAIDDSLSPQLTTTFGALQETIEGIGQHLNSTNTEALRSIVDEFSNQFQNQAKQSILEMVAAIETVTNSMSTSSAAILAAFADARDILDTVRSEGQQAFGATRSLLDGFNTTITRLEGISEQLRVAAVPVSLAAENAGNIIGALRETQMGATDMVARLPAIAEGFSGIDRDLSAVFESIHSALTRELDDIRSFITELDGSFSKALGGVHEITSDLTSGVTDLTSGLSEFSEAINKFKLVADTFDGSLQSRLDAAAPRNGSNAIPQS